MQSVILNIFNLIENFIDISNKKCCLNMGAKYYNFSMNDASTICLANMSATLQKSYGQPHSF